MEYSKKLNLALPSRDNDVDLADINQISENFRIIDENIVVKSDIDAELSATSENPVQNKVIKAALEELKNFVISAAQNLVSYDAMETRLQNVPTYDDINSAVQDATQNLPTVDDVNQAIQMATQNLPTTDYVNQAIQEALYVNTEEVIE